MGEGYEVVVIILYVYCFGEVWIVFKCVVVVDLVVGVEDVWVVLMEICIDIVFEFSVGY